MNIASEEKKAKIVVKHETSEEKESEAALDDPTLTRRILVFGLPCLPQDTKVLSATKDQLLSVFTEYGDIEECKVFEEGCGFVLFKTRESAQKSLKEKVKKIGDHMVGCQLASDGVTGPKNNQTADTTDTLGRKIFVDKVASHVNPNALKSLFAKFGEIEDGPSGMDAITGEFKGYAMFVYKTIEECKKALEEPTKVFEGRELNSYQAI